MKDINRSDPLHMILSFGHKENDVVCNAGTEEAEKRRNRVGNGSKTAKKSGSYTGC